jgi:hypothetical protein
MTEPETEAQAKGKSDKQIVWGGCQTVLAFGGIIVALFIFDWKAAALLQHLSLDKSRDLIVLVHFKRLANEMFWGVAFAPLILLLAASLGKSVRASLVVLGVCFALLAVLAFRFWFVPFIALEARGSTLRLIHLWPRQVTTIEISMIRSTAIEETTTGGDVPQVIERLVIETTDGPYRSMYGGDASGAAERIKRLR